MHLSPALAPDPHRLARAFLALTDEPAQRGPDTAERSLTRWLAAFAAVVVLAVAVPLSWLAPGSRPLAKPSDQPAATLSSSKALLTAADDEDDDGGE